MISLLLAASLAWGAPHDDRCRSALDLLYDGSTDTALDRLAALAEEHPDDALVGYLEALAMAWKVEQQPQSRALDPRLRQYIEGVLAVANRRLAVDPGDARARLARAGAHGVRSRFHLLRREARAAAKASVLMREDLLRLHRQDPEQKDVRFGLGLYDYFADVLPRPMKLLRLLAGLPEGDRTRGMAWIEEARTGSFFHQTEARVQWFDIHVFWDPRPDRALAEMRLLRQQYPGSPLWALRLADHLRNGVGLYAESASVARAIVRAHADGHPNYAPVVAEMARLRIGEALRLDLRLGAAREALRSIRPTPESPGLFERAQYLLGQVLEIEGDRGAAQRCFESAEQSPDSSVRRAAADARRHPLSPERLRALDAIGVARRAYESGQEHEAAERYRDALELWPNCQEASLRVAEADLDRGDVEAARRRLDQLAERDRTDPPWVLPWVRLLQARVQDLGGQRAAALLGYRQVLDEPFGQDALRDLAASGIDHPYLPKIRPASLPPKSKYSK